MSIAQAGEGVTEAVGVDLRLSGPPAQAPQHLGKAVRLQYHARPHLAVLASREKERTGHCTPVTEVGDERFPATRGEGDNSLPVPFGVKDPQPTLIEVKVFEVELHDFGAADARVEQG